MIYTIGARDKIEIDEYPGHRSYYHDWYFGGWGRYYYPYFGAINEERIDEYIQGEIAIDIFDGKSRQAVWHAIASKRLSSKELRPGNTDFTLVVDMLFAELPPIKAF